MSLTPLPTPSDDDHGLYEDLTDDDRGFQARSLRVGIEFKHQARDWLLGGGATFMGDHHRIGSYPVEGLICGGNDRQFLVLAHGTLDDGDQAGLRRSDTVKKAGFDAIQIRRLRPLPILLLTSHLPPASSVVSAMLADCACDIFDVMVIHGEGSFADFQRLHRYLHEDPFPGQLPAAWRASPSVWTPELFDDPDEPIPMHLTFGASSDDVDEEAY